MNSFCFAVHCFFKLLKDREFTAKVRDLDAPKAVKEAGKLNVDAVRVLALFQREGRFVDFLQEDIQGFDDAQIGAAVRSVHQGSRKVLQEYFTLEPVLKGKEGSVVTVPQGFDPSAIRLVGQVSGDPPFRGTLGHHGWKAIKAALPMPPQGQDQTVVAPAEVEISS